MMNFQFCEFCDFFQFFSFWRCPGLDFLIFKPSRFFDYFNVASLNFIHFLVSFFKIRIGIRFRLAIFLSSMSFYERFTSQRGTTNGNCQSHIVQCVQSTYMEHGTNATVPTWMIEYSFPFWNLQDSSTVSNWSFVEIYFRFLAFLFKIDVVVVGIGLSIFCSLMSLKDSLTRTTRTTNKCQIPVLTFNTRQNRPSGKEWVPRRARFQIPVHSTRDKTNHYEKNEYYHANESDRKQIKVAQTRKPKLRWNSSSIFLFFSHSRWNSLIIF